MLILYRIFTFIIYYLSFPFTYLAGSFGSAKWRHRLGHIPYHNNENSGKTVWLHASSMGEVKVLSILKSCLEKLDSSVSIIITVMTETGFKSAGKLLSEKKNIAYLPLDYFPAIRRYLESAKPDAAVFIETEIWPNLIYELGKKKIPIFLANGRLSERSFRSYRKFRNSLKLLFKNYSRLMVQTKIDKDRFVGIGAAEDQIDILGNLKLDAPINSIREGDKNVLRNSLPFQEGSKILIAGSTRQMEHNMVLKTYKKLSENISGLKLILAPRHLDRISDIRRQADKLNIPYRLHSDSTNSKSGVDLLLVDKMGILNKLYAVSDIAFVGGTLVDIGGHNILEPVWSGTPVLYGLSISNVSDSSEYIIENSFGAQVKGVDDLYDKLTQFFDGNLVFNKKTEKSEVASRAHKTAQIILDGIKSDG